MVSNQFGKTAEARNAVVHTQVRLGKPKDMDGFGLEVEIQVEGVDQELIDAGHAVSIRCYFLLSYLAYRTLNGIIGLPVQSGAERWSKGHCCEEIIRETEVTNKTEANVVA